MKDRIHIPALFRPRRGIWQSDDALAKAGRTRRAQDVRNSRSNILSDAAELFFPRARVCAHRAAGESHRGGENRFASLGGRHELVG